MANRNRGLDRLDTAVRDALASASGRQGRAVVEVKRQEHGRQQNRRYAPWERANAPVHSMVMRR